MKALVGRVCRIRITFFFAACLLLVNNTVADTHRYLDHSLKQNILTITTTQANITITAVGEGALEVFYQQDGIKQLPSFALQPGLQPNQITLRERPGELLISAPGIRALVEKQPFSIAYFHDDNRRLVEQTGYFADQSNRGFRFALDENEKLLGGGERVLGMDRRGHRLPLYNRAHYGYTTYSEQMYFSMPAVLSSNKYLLVFDNSARGLVDLGKTEPDVLQFEAVGGRTAYLVITGASYPQIIENYVAVSGRQPLPPRWAFGNYASRFGYRTEQQTRDVVARFREQDFPLDAVVLDLFWFGPDIKGHVGNLDWDRNAFPTPEKMIADFKAQGVNTIVITEPFILSSSKRWQEAVEQQVLAKDATGAPKRFDFYFGNTGLIDVFDERASDWFWNIYRGLLKQGVAGLWGDLGEPEVHPADALHALGTGDELHNAYGHRWAELVFTNHVALYPHRRPFIMMRSGFPGSQRYGMIPWTGDVSRSWGGLQSQVELSLQMGLLGMGYIHSDLGGFAGGEVFDRELYIRWLQYGVFQPVYRPHAQDHIPSEPVFHDRRTRTITREFIKLRYRLLPYNYTLAWQNSTSGMPLARPLFFEDENNPELMDNRDSFLWGDAFLVSPVVEPGIKKQRVSLPQGVWFDYWNDKRYQGDATAEIPVTLKTIPVLVRAGAFIPMVGDMDSTRDYSSRQLTLHYYADESVKRAEGIMYNDDGETLGAFEKQLYELLRFRARHHRQQITFDFSRETYIYRGMPDAREITLVVHNWQTPVRKVAVSGRNLPVLKRRVFRKSSEGAWYDKKNRLLNIKFRWGGEQLAVKVNP